MRILYAEDRAELRALAARSIPDPHRLIVAGNGQQALNLLMVEEVDIVVTDHEMPEMTGLELLRSIRENPNLHHLPVVLVSSGGNEDLVEEVQRLGGVFIPKPFTWREILPRLESLIN